MSSKEVETAAWIHMQGRHKEVSERPLDNEEVERGWVQEELVCRSDHEAAIAALRADAERMDWLEAAYSEQHPMAFRSFMTTVAERGFRAAIDAHLKGNDK